jgi:hypothetical protein
MKALYRAAALILMVALGVTASTGCKIVTDAKTESFRATRKGWWPFGEEKTAMLLHQYVYDESSVASTKDYGEPMLNAVRGINSCWYPLEAESKQIKPLVDGNKISELYDLAPVPVSEIAIPLPQLLKSMESVPQLRKINDSLDRSAVRMASSFIVSADLLDYALCAGAVGLVGGSIAGGPFTIGTAPLAFGAAATACSVGLGMSGATSFVKDPANDRIFNPINDKIADGASAITKDGPRRRQAVMEKLQLVQDNQGQLRGSVEREVAQMPEIGWDEMEILNKLVRDLGDPKKSTYPDGTPKDVRQSNRCQAIPILKAQGKFYSPDLEQLPTGVQAELRERGYTPNDISQFNNVRKPNPPVLGPAGGATTPQYSSPSSSGTQSPTYSSPY